MIACFPLALIVTVLRALGKGVFRSHRGALAGSVSRPYSCASRWRLGLAAGAAAVVLTLVSIAGYVPAHRASVVDPMAALRYE